MTTVGAHGEGTIGKRRADGRIAVSVMRDGLRLYRMVPAMGDAKAQQRLAQRIRRELVGQSIAGLHPSSQRLAEYLRSWVAGLPDARRKRKPRTIEFYAMIVEQHIARRPIGRIRLDRLTPRHVQAWLDKEPGSERSVHHYHAVLRQALNVAANQRLIPYNPALGVELGEAAEFEGSPLTFPELRALLAVPDRLAALWRLAAITGLRQGELLGLTWEDVDLDAGKVAVVAQLARLNGKWIRSEPKTDRALKRLAIDPDTVEVLWAHRLAQAAERTPAWRYYGMVFVTPKGEPISRSDCLRLFHAACDAAGIERRRFHDLRHTSNRHLEDLGIPENVRKARFGWSSSRMPRHYGGASEAQDREAVTRYAEAIG